MYIKNTLIAICFGLFPLQAIYAQTTIVNDSIIREESTKLFNRGYYNKSIAKCLCIDSCSHLKDDYIILAKNYEHLENLDSAIIYRRKAFIKDNNDSENLVTLSKDFMDSGLPDSSLVYLNQYKDIDSTNLVVNRQRAFALYTLTRYKDALDQYKSLKSMGDNQATSNYYMGLCYMKTDNIIKAYKCLDIAVKQTQRKNPYILSQYGIACQQMKITMYAIDALKESIEMLKPDPDLMISLYEGLGYSYTINREYKLANNYYKEAMKIRPIIRDYYYLGFNYYSMGDYDSSQKYLNIFVDKVNKCKSPDNFKNFMEDSRTMLDKIKEEKFYKGNKTKSIHTYSIEPK